MSIDNIDSPSNKFIKIALVRAAAHGALDDRNQSPFRKRRVEYDVTKKIVAFGRVELRHSMLVNQNDFVERRWTFVIRVSTSCDQTGRGKVPNGNGKED